MPNPENIQAHKFEEGQSGNPNGRPKGAKNRSTIARLWLDAMQRQKNPISGSEEDLSQEDIITLQQINKARKGDTNAYNALMNSAYGAPKQEITMPNKIKVKFNADSEDGN